MCRAGPRYRKRPSAESEPQVGDMPNHKQPELLTNRLQYVKAAFTRITVAYWAGPNPAKVNIFNFTARHATSAI